MLAISRDRMGNVYIFGYFAFDTEILNSFGHLVQW
uniref:Uncharacterized protein n=1 Tax=Rhizophora mucronata TaxID=61149 RepID=A0A2P2J4B1_RHIMU